MKELTNALLKKGSRCLTLSFHSSSLQPGFTPYCSSEADVERLMNNVESYLGFFREELGGSFTSPLSLYASLKAQKREFHAA
jgi:hypothetical protein